MKTSFILLLLVAVAFACDAGYGKNIADECVPCPNGYYSSGDACVYCNGATNAAHTSCSACESGKTYIAGECVSATAACKTNNALYGQSRPISCDSGYFGIKTKSCIYEGKGKTTEISYNKGCYSNARENGGIPAGFAAINIVLHTRGLMATTFTPNVKVSIIYALVSQFPFAIGDVQIGGVVTVATTAGSAPECLIYLRILTSEDLMNHFYGENVSYTQIAYSLTLFLQQRFSYVYHNQFVIYEFEISSIISSSYTCPAFPEDTLRDVYYIGESYHYECPLVDGKPQYGTAYKKCIVSEDGNAVWSAPILKDCVTILPPNRNTVIDLQVTIHKISYLYINCNITLELYPIFVSTASTRLKDINIYDYQGIEEESGYSSTTFRVRYYINNSLYYYEQEDEAAPVLAVDKLWELFDTPAHKATTAEILTKKFIEVYPSNFAPAEFEITSAIRTEPQSNL